VCLPWGAQYRPRTGLTTGKEKRTPKRRGKKTPVRGSKKNKTSADCSSTVHEKLGQNKKPSEGKKQTPGQGQLTLLLLKGGFHNMGEGNQSGSEITPGIGSHKTQQQEVEKGGQKSGWGGDCGRHIRVRARPMVYRDKKVTPSLKRTTKGRGNKILARPIITHPVLGKSEGGSDKKGKRGTSFGRCSTSAWQESKSTQPTI